LMLAILGTWNITQSENWSGSERIGVAGFESGMGEGESGLGGPLGSAGIENSKHSKGETWLICTPQMTAVFSLDTLVHCTLCGQVTHKTTWIFPAVTTWHLLCTEDANKTRVWAVSWPLSTIQIIPRVSFAVMC
jgi:hypothetical protein